MLLSIHHACTEEICGIWSLRCGNLWGLSQHGSAESLASVNKEVSHNKMVKNTSASHLAQCKISQFKNISSGSGSGISEPAQMIKKKDSPFFLFKISRQTSKSQPPV